MFRVTPRFPQTILIQYGFFTMKWIFFFVMVLILSCNPDDEYAPFPGNRPSPPDGLTNDVVVSTTTPETIDINFEQDTITYLALGDSYTIGSGEKPENRYPNLLSQELIDRGYFFKAPRIIATTGWTTGNLIYAVNNPPIDIKYDLVSLLIGVNNQYGGGSFELFKKEFIDLLEFSLSKANSRSGVFVLSIPDYGATPFGASNAAKIFEEINMYNDFIKQVCQANRVKYYDITEISRKAKDDLSYLASDRLHPSRKMYLEWVALILKDPPPLLIR